MKEILSGFDKILFPAVPKSLIGSRSEVLKEMGHKVFETKCYVFVLKDESKLVTVKYRVTMVVSNYILLTLCNLCPLCS